MEYKCPLPGDIRNEAANLKEFANGAAQATIKLKDGREFRNVLISNANAVVAVRGYQIPPFKSDEIAQVYQVAEDRSPTNRGGWEFWDDWK